jgi:23S rRNA maturation mini-RNase III
MIENTPIKTTLDRAFTGLETMLGVTRQKDTEEQEAKVLKRIKAHKAKKKRLDADDPEYSMPF